MSPDAQIQQPPDDEGQELSQFQKAEAFVETTGVIFSFADTVIKPCLLTIIEPTRKEQAIIYTYFRIHYLLETLSRYDKPRHYQSVSSAIRTIFELFLDIRYLAEDRNDNVEKYYAFVKVERFRRANMMVKFYDNQKLDLTSVIKQREFINDPNTIDEVSTNLQNLWNIDFQEFCCGKAKISHWTKKNTRARARELGIEYEKLYVDLYPMLSWYIHSIPAGNFNDLDAYHCLIGYSHSYAHGMILETVQQCGIVFHLNQLDNLQSSLDQIISDLRQNPILRIDEKLKNMTKNSN